MAFNLRVIFTGLCAYIPEHDWLNTILVATDDATADPSLGMHRHDPFMAVSLESWVRGGNNRQPDALVADLKGDTLAFFWLGREELTIRSGIPLSLERYDPGCEIPRTQREAGNLSWIPSIGSLLRGDEFVVDESILRDFPGSVASRVRIQGGQVRTQNVARGEDGFLLWEFKTHPAGPALRRQALGDLVAVELTVPDAEEERDAPQVLSTRRGGSLFLSPTSVTDRVDLVIGNLTLRDPHALHHVHDAREGLGHFRWFYELLPEGHRPPRDRRPIPFPAGLGAMRPTGGTCPQTFFVA